MVFCDAPFHLLEKEDVYQSSVKFFLASKQVVDSDVKVGFNVLVKLILESVVPVVSSLARVMLHLFLGEVYHFPRIPVSIGIVPPHYLTKFNILCPRA